MDENIYKSATFSEDRVYRYTLTRSWSPDLGICTFIGLNPSTADEYSDDPTIRRCIEFAKAWGYGELKMLNLFAYRATDPRVMKAVPDPVGPKNMERLQTFGRLSDMVIAAWGTHGNFRGQGEAVKKLIPNLHYLRLNKDGSPAHPLYLPKTLKPIKFEAQC